MLYGRFAILADALPASAPFDEARAMLGRYLDPESVEGRRLRARALGSSERIPILGDGLFALENAYLTKAEAECPFEAHLRYADLQAMVEGEEYLDVDETAALETATPHDPERDIAFYRARTPLARLRLAAGFATLLLPRDAHRPGVTTGASPAPVRKVVFKIDHTLLKNMK